MATRVKKRGLLRTVVPGCGLEGVFGYAFTLSILYIDFNGANILENDWTGLVTLDKKD